MIINDRYYTKLSQKKKVEGYFRLNRECQLNALFIEQSNRSHRMSQKQLIFFLIKYLIY